MLGSHWFPSDVLVSIFVYLDERDRAAAACSCKGWYQASKHPHLSWVEIVNRTLHSWHTKRRPLQELPTWRSPASAVVFAAGTSAQDDLLFVVNSTGERIEVKDKTWNKPSLFVADSPFRLEKEQLDERLYRVSITEAIPERPSDDPRGQLPVAWHIQLLLNVRRLEEYVRKKEPIANFEWLMKNIEKAAKPFRDLFANDRFFPKKESDQRSGFAADTKLYRSQCTAVQWMKSVEDQLPATIEYCPLASFPRTSLLFRFDPPEIFLREEHHQDGVKLFKASATVRGGMLIDETSHNATMEVLGLILANPAPAKFLVRPPKHTAGNNRLIPTKATLIVSLPERVWHWRELLRVHAPHLRVLTISCLPDINDLQIGHLVEADVVLLSVWVLSHVRYNDAKCAEEAQLARIRALWKAIEGLSYSAALSQPACFEQVRFFRVVAERGSRRASDLVTALVLDNIATVAANRWIAIPDVHVDLALREAVRFLVEKKPDQVGKDDGSKDHLIELLLRGFCWRNTARSAATDCRDIPIVREAVLYDLHPQEALQVDLLASITNLANINKALKRKICNVLKRDTIWRDQRPAIEWDRKSPDHPLVIMKRWIEKLNSNSVDWPVSGPEQRQLLVTLFENYRDQFTALPSYSSTALLKERLDWDEWSEPESSEDDEENDQSFGAAKRKKRATAAAKRVTAKKKKQLKVHLPEEKADIDENERHLQDLSHIHGSEIAHFIVWLQQLLSSDPTAQVVVALMMKDDEEPLVGRSILELNGIVCRDRITQHKDNSACRVTIVSVPREPEPSEYERCSYILYNITHLVLFGSVLSDVKSEKRREANAISHIFPQGTAKRVAVVRFLVRHSAEHKNYESFIAVEQEKQKKKNLVQQDKQQKMK